MLTCTVKEELTTWSSFALSLWAEAGQVAQKFLLISFTAVCAYKWQGTNGQSKPTGWNLLFSKQIFLWYLDHTRLKAAIHNLKKGWLPPTPQSIKDLETLSVTPSDFRTSRTGLGKRHFFQIVLPWPPSYDPKKGTLTFLPLRSSQGFVYCGLEVPALGCHWQAVHSGS